MYLKEQTLKVETLGRGFAWLDTGSHANMLQARQFVEAIENRQGLMIACLEEIAFEKGWIQENKVEQQSSLFQTTPYGAYLDEILNTTPFA